MEKPIILKAAKLPEATVAELKATFDVIDLPTEPEAARAVLEAEGARVRGVALRKTIIDTAFLEALPQLEIISSYSAGLDNVDVPAVKARGIVIENTSHILAEDVANAALGLALAVTRDLVQADGFVRAGKWPGQPQYRLGRSISRMKVGIVGLGTIGQALARRLEAMGAEVHYHGPRAKPVDYPFHADPADLAAVCDMVILTCPLSEATRHLVDARVLEALGPRGFLINVARGPVVDEAALLACLAADGLAGAALDVFEHEPQVPEALIADPRVVLTPHLGSGTEETRQAMADHVVDSLARHFAVPGPRSRPALASAGQVRSA
ncbi:2-hydroxyacid dehydrogenase [Pseudooceanicola sp. CBS1P-1]|uniref:2-hydroxyacid dehydrogenase n=1 Tax=Pseudooceanicola albus TaxID=2692189 RepID=A0A6L7GEL8_9RHOB|nr:MULTISPECIES: 2-hydroxyacid dehydrogenase [Pseudooceanicola]MBT9387034.1 2-hydroxyacid dehydrogenase [Pseudooceanicola endophyticus]MXN21193.1 2-hydroxyacid dehydrogenase [Pseudooceanicola albus]